MTPSCSCADKKQGCGAAPVPEWLCLPVAPHGVARLRFAGSAQLPQPIPLQGALSWIGDLQERGRRIGGLELHGPGDPLASLRMTVEILDQLQENQPNISLGITTLGLGLVEHAEELRRHGVERITLLVDAVQAELVEQLYSWIRPGKRNIPLQEGAAIVIAEQAKAVSACLAVGLRVTIQTTLYHNINEQEVPDIAKTFVGLGAESMTLVPGQGWAEGEEELPLPVLSPEIMANLNDSAAQHITILAPPVVQNLHQCAGHESCTCGTIGLPKPSASKPNVAALSSNGMDIDLHLGQAIKALIYGPREDGLPCLLESRDLPEPGHGGKRWLELAEILADCCCLLAEAAGQTPKETLSKQGLPVILINDNVEGTVDALYGGGKKGKCKK